MKILVLDGNSILNRAFYGIKLLTTKSGQYTNAIYGFMNILLKLEDAEKPDEVAVAFDLPAPTFRHKMYDGYKAKRKGMPEELAAQMPVLKELLALLGYAEVSREGFEADDILGTLAKAAKQRGEACLLATGDRDTLQLVGDGVTVLLTTTQMGRGETVRMDEAAVWEKYGVTPKQLIDAKGLMGDASDNIPGVPGVGEKTAFALIQQFGSLGAVYENLDDESIKPGVREKLKVGRESAEMSYALAEIDCAVPIDTAAGTYKKKPADAAGAAALLSKLEMYSILDRLGLDKAPAPAADENAPALPEVQPKPLQEALAGMVFLAPAEGGGFVVVPAGKQEVFYAAADDAALLALLRDEKAYKRVFSSKELHKLALAEQSGSRPAQSVVFDAKLAAYLLNPAAASYTVQRLAAEYDTRPAFACPAQPDAPYLEPLYRKLSEECAAAGMTKLLMEIEQPLAEVLASMELVGMAIDAAGLRAFGDELQAELQKQLASIYQEVGYEFNLNSPKQLGEALFEKMGLPARKKTKSGFSTDAETLESLREYSPVIDTILLYRTYQKLNSTYVEGLLKEIGPDGRIHSTFNQTEARTGRISSNEPNLQNIPIRTELGSRLRRFFVAPEGTLLADADYSQIELRILADISGDEAMRAAFQNGEDIHRATAARVHGLPQSMVTPQLRASAKAVNFGIVYGIGAFSLSKDIGVSVKEADEFIKSYLDSFPGVKAYMDKTVEDGKEHGYVQTLYGRRRPLPELASSNRNIQAVGRRMAMNTPIQGTAADIIKLAMIRVWRRLRAEGLSAMLVLQVHDELIVQAPKAEVPRVAAILKEEMEGAATLAVPLQADVHTGQNWLDAKG
ncbi:DNA polymerase I [Ruminococcaceae bacterium OttesenSCG-928-O06]|nr:DNA polymerase I [Ruminococcaceae bacterium OttesenSCG-928-O06]